MLELEWLQAVGQGIIDTAYDVHSRTLFAGDVSADDEQPRLRELLFGQQLARGRARKLSQELQAAIDVTERLL